MLTAEQKLAYARQVGYPKEGWLLYVKDNRVVHARITDKPYKVQQEEITFTAPAWIPQDVVDNYIKEQV